jgi:hypothetical protein
MFEVKKEKLFDTEIKSSTFVDAGLKKSAETLSGNNALKYSTTGNCFVDQFGLIGSYKQPRSYGEITYDCELCYAENPQDAIKFIFYIRTITRVVRLFDGTQTTETQKGAQLKHEAIMRMIWLHTTHPDIFWKNIGLFVSLGSWKDIIVMLMYDLIYHGWDGKVLNWNKMTDLLLSGLENNNVCELIKKYLPTLKSNTKCTTVESQAKNMTAKYICYRLFANEDLSIENSKSLDNLRPSLYKRYRLLKSSGTAHQWQQLISRKQFERIDFNTIHGRALNLLVKGKFLKNSGLKEKYTEFVKKSEHKTLKYTGFVHELMQMCTSYIAISAMPEYEQETVNKQFAELIKKAGTSEQAKFIVVRDTSGSMGSRAVGTNMTCCTVAKSLALYFSYFLKGKFTNSWIEFNQKAVMHKWKGETPCQRWFYDRTSCIGSTNFQSVIDLFIDIKRRGVSEDDFPTGILCISDSEFNPAVALNTTNVQEALGKLKRARFSKKYVDNFVIILWNLQNYHYGKGNSGNKFETYGDVPNVYYFSGYEPSIISFLTGEIKNAWELFQATMNQEILNRIEI